MLEHGISEQDPARKVNKNELDQQKEANIRKLPQQTLKKILNGLQDQVTMKFKSSLGD